MGGFFTDLGQGIAAGMRKRASQTPLGSAILGAYGRRHQQQQGDVDTDYGPLSNFNQQVDDESNPTVASPDPAAWDATMAQGGIVTKPTVALLGEKGPEVVQPLTDQPGNRVSPVLGMGSLRTRHRMPSGPNASRHFAPLRADLPLGPNKAFR